MIRAIYERNPRWEGGEELFTGNIYINESRSIYPYKHRLKLN